MTSVLLALGRYFALWTLALLPPPSRLRTGWDPQVRVRVEVRLEAQKTKETAAMTSGENLPRVKRTEEMGFHALRLRATPSPWDVKTGQAKYPRLSAALPSRALLRLRK